MASIVNRLYKKKLVSPPSWLPDMIFQEVIMGSEAYGVSSNSSDIDVVGFCIPKKDMVFPHLAGEIPGFGTQIKRFEQWLEHHIKDTDSGKEYDIVIYNIVKYFQLCMENNPNMIDSLFVPDRCILHTTAVGQLVRDSRKLFLHKGCWHKFKGYAFSQMHKAKLKNPAPNSKRAANVAEFGFDCKFAYHVVRLMLEVEQILTEGDLDLERSREQLKAIRRGEFSLEQVEQLFSDKEKQLEKVYTESSLRYVPDEAAIRQLLLNCLEHHYGSLADSVVSPDQAVLALREIQRVLENNRNIF